MNSESRCLQALERIARDESLNAWCFVDRDGALAAARESDRRQQQGASLGPMDGRLIAVKANVAVQDWPWDAGLTRLRSRIAQEDAPVISDLRSAGAVLLGLTCMDEAALGASGVSINGPIHLPHSPALSPGGSSGGAAVAVAARHCDAAIGTDTLGSVRIPAALCGLAGFKPRHHSLSLQGIEPLHPQHDQLGPIAADIDMLLDVWQVMAPAAHRSRKPAETEPAHEWSIVALPHEALQSLPSATADTYLRTLEQATRHGLSLQHVEHPHDREVIRECIDLLAGARRALFILCEQALAKHWRLISEGALDGFSDTLKDMLRYGAVLSAEKESQLKHTLRHFTARWQQCTLNLQSRFGEALIWALPTTSVSSFAHRDGPPKDLADWTALASITGWPALTLPSQRARDVAPKSPQPQQVEHPPFGLQLVAAQLNNETLCLAGREVSRYLLASGNPNTLGAADM